MGTTNWGTQNLSYDYNQEATAKLFNIVNYKILPKGIYNGFTISKLSNTSVEISTGICLIEDAINKVCVRIETSDTQNITVSNSTPYIVFRMEWVDSPNIYMDMLSLAYKDIQETDIIVGKCIYDTSGSTLGVSFDYTRRTDSFFNKQNTQSQYLKVSPTEPPTNKVSITSGVLNSSKGSLLVAGGDFPDIGVSPTVNGRIDIIYVDENGDIKILEGADSSSPVAPRYGNRKIIAEIQRGASKSIIVGNEIFPVLTSFDVPPITKDLLIQDVGSAFGSDNVEDALQEIALQEFVFKNIKNFEGQVSVSATAGKVAEKIKGASGQNIQEIRKSNNSLVQRVDQNGKLINTAGSEISIVDVGNVFTVDQLEAALNQMASSTFTFKGNKAFTNNVDVSGSTTLKAMSASSGNITTLTTNTVNTTSSREKKKDIKLYDGDALDLINKTKIVEYVYKDDTEGVKHIGFIAEDTPSEMSGVKKDTMVLSDTIGVILKAIQELNEKIGEK